MSDEANARGQAEGLLQERATARESRDFARADALRDDINALGFEVLDGPEGPSLGEAASVTASGGKRERAPEAADVQLERAKEVLKRARLARKG